MATNNNNEQDHIKALAKLINDDSFEEAQDYWEDNETELVDIVDMKDKLNRALAALSNNYSVEYRTKPAPPCFPKRRSPDPCPGPSTFLDVKKGADQLGSIRLWGV